MRKYFSIFKISIEDEFTYKLNFILWRLRNVIQICMTYFVWSTVYSDPSKIILGYDRAKILTYVFGIMIVKAIVMSARSMDVGNDISTGDLSNYLVKPVSYFKYFFTRDIASKLLNLFFAAIEFTLLLLILKPPFVFQTNLYSIIGFLISVILAVCIYSLILFLLSSIPFWVPELGWSAQFLIVIVVVEAFSGSIFPINILPHVLQWTIMATPFPYLIYFPVEVYLGNITGWTLIGGIMVSAAWTGILWFTLKIVWRRGLKAYQAFGR